MAEEDKVNLMGELYTEFLAIAKSLVIKYSVKAEQYETLETKLNADLYLDVINGKDDFYTYLDYTANDYYKAGWDDYYKVREAIQTQNTELVPKQYRQKVLEIRRQRILDTFEEQNNYYRLLNGYPDIEDSEYYYPSEYLQKNYGFPKDIPIHKIQDWGNRQEEGKGDYLISIAEGSGFIAKLKELHPDKKYLNYIGSNRISIKKAREAFNFQILSLSDSGIRRNVYDQFVLKYEQCREYFVKTIYVNEYRNIIEKYDNFIALCIFLYTIQQMCVDQLMSGVKRSFYSIYGVRALFQAYDLPYNLNIDEETQNALVRNLNLFIQNKSTNKVFYNIAEILGFSNLKVYKYYLGKERKFDRYGIPIVAYTEKFNSLTGENEIVPDYEKMYDLYFQREDMRSHDLFKSVMFAANKQNYDEITQNDPFWIIDQNLYDRVWQTEYNYVESKYLGIGVAYSMTNVLFENVILLKLLLRKRDDISGLTISIPRIVPGLKIPLYDAIIFLICLTAAKHNLTGEIITIPTQVINVIDYMNNVEDTSHLVDTLEFNFEYFNEDNEKAKDQMKQLKKLLGDNKYNEFKSYIDAVKIDSVYTPKDKIKKINELYNDIISLHKFLVFEMTRTSSRKVYELLKNMNNAIFYSKELRSVFTITGEITETERTAWTYYEYLYHLNPTLYKAVFSVDLKADWKDYCDKHSLTQTEFTYEDFLIQVEYGNIRVDYGKVNVESEDAKDSLIYTYVNHVIDRLSHLIGNLNYMYLMNDLSTPLSDLLEKLIRFFKSYTVDLINFDILFYMDMKPENTIKLFEEIYKITKIIGVDENVKLSFSDVVSKIEASLNTQDHLSIEDRWAYMSILKISKEYGPNNEITLYDLIDLMTKTIQVSDKDGITHLDDIVDSMHVEYNVDSKFKLKDKLQYDSKIEIRDNTKLRDSVILKYEDD